MAGKSPFSTCLSEFRHLLKHLPDALPIHPLNESRYRRIVERDFDSDWVQDIGEAGEATRVLEVTFPNAERVPHGKDECVPILTERGEAVEALANFLETYHGYAESSVIFEHWARVLCIGARYTFERHGKVSTRF